MSDRVYLFTVQRALNLFLEQTTPTLRQELTLKGIPTPPTSNNAYANAAKGRRLTPESNLWKYEMNAWAMENVESLANLAIMGRAQRPMACECLFFFPRGDVYSKAGEVKNLDAPNFQKLLIDHLCIFGMFDDKMFFRTEAEKAIGLTKRLVDMRIWFMEPVVQTGKKS